MKSYVYSALAAIAGAFCVPVAANAADFDGTWRGLAEPLRGSCPGFEIKADVVDFEVSGAAISAVKVLTGGRSSSGDRTVTYELDITGSVTSDGRIEGEVSKVGFKLAELSGEVDRTVGVGQWRTTRGPACEGTFKVERIGG